MFRRNSWMKAAFLFQKTKCLCTDQGLSSRHLDGVPRFVGVAFEVSPRMCERRDPRCFLNSEAPRNFVFWARLFQTILNCFLTHKRGAGIGAALRGHS